ncbi:MAG: alternative ribosome rescue aminoacyl-tRNA hydrolase ArfB [Bacteroidota bacterium]|nr:alternative ribosome rescue aminoacyl-tRNA hydrolase ArfB [Bacteroidota bacterium]
MLSKELLLNELTFKAVRSSGSGGQNVNKVSTKVELRFDIENSEFLTEDEKARIFKKLKNRISNECILIITSDTERTQLRNKNKAIEIFFDLIERALKKPKKRKKTKPTLASKEKRLKEKKIQSEKKQFRKGKL